MTTKASTNRKNAGTLWARGWTYWKENGVRKTLEKIRYRYASQRRLRELFLPGPGELRRQRAETFPKMPKISLAVPVYNTPERLLREMLDSVRAQSYANWELCLADGSDDAHGRVGEILRRAGEGDPRVRYEHIENRGIAGNSNAALAMATGEYVGLLDHDDVLPANALYEFAKALNEPDPSDMMYSDEGMFDTRITRMPRFHFKPDFAPDNLRGNNYICHLLVAEKALFEAVGGFLPGVDGSQDHDLILRMSEKARKIRHIAKPLYFWRFNPVSTSNRPGGIDRCAVSGVKAVQRHLDRRGDGGTAEIIPPYTLYRVRYEIPGTPLVSVVVRRRGDGSALERCLASIRAKTTYSRYEILSGTPEEASARGDYLLFVDDTAEVLSPDWIQEMLMMCARKDTGVCGAKLYRPDGTVWHAGVLIGSGPGAGTPDGLLGYPFRGFPGDDPGYYGRLTYQSDYSAVSFECAMVKRSVFEELGGLDGALAGDLQAADFCLKVREKGLLVAWTPFAELVRHGEEGRLENTADGIAAFRRRWGGTLRGLDPYFNPNLAKMEDDWVHVRL